MAKTALSQLKNWFLNGMKPPQEHFWNWLDSFWHKDDLIPMENIEDLSEALGGKSDIDHSHAGYMVKNAENVVTDDWSVTSENHDDKVSIKFNDSKEFEVIPADFEVDNVGAMVNIKSKFQFSEGKIKLFAKRDLEPYNYKGDAIFKINEVTTITSYGSEFGMIWLYPKDIPLSPSESYPELGLSGSSDLRDFNGAIVAEALTETAIITISHPNEVPESFELYNGFAYFPYDAEIISIEAVCCYFTPIGTGLSMMIELNNVLVYEGANDNFTIPIGERRSDNVSSLVGQTINEGDRMTFFVGDADGVYGLQVIMKFKRVVIPAP